MDPGKIHVGAGNLVLNPGTDDIDLGFCSDGATLTYNRTAEPLIVDQALPPVGFFIPGEDCQFETILAEMDATKLMLAMGTPGAVVPVAAGVGQKGYNEIKFGGQTDVTEYSLEYTAPKRTNRNLGIVVRLHFVVISAELSVAFTKDGKSGIRFVAKARADITQTAGEQLGYIREETAEPTDQIPVLAVSSTDPADGSGAVARNKAIDFTFNRAVHPESVHTGNFILVTAVGNAVTCTAARVSQTVVRLTPAADMAGTTVHIAVAAKDVMALSDRTRMADNHVIDFTTVA